MSVAKFIELYLGRHFYAELQSISQSINQINQSDILTWIKLQ